MARARPAFRHFFASWCINPRADGGRELPAEVGSGAARTFVHTITLDTYGHLFPRIDDAAELAKSIRSLLSAT